MPLYHAAGNAIMRTIILPVTALLAMTAGASAQPLPPDEVLQALIDAHVAQGRAVGIVLGVLDADGTTRIFSAGTAGAGGRPLGERSLFEIGSNTKVFTATILADMVRRGEVQLSDPLSLYLPPGVRAPTYGGREITLLDLATHTSGLPSEPDNMAPETPADFYAGYTAAHLHAFLHQHRLRREPGAQFEYSNLGMGLLGHLLSRAAGADYETLVRQRLLEPLGMQNTGIRPGEDARRRMTTGHDIRGVVTRYIDTGILAGAGALSSDSHDMLRFLAAHVGEPTSDLEEAMRSMREPRAKRSETGSVGLGWLIRAGTDSRIVWHNGATPGFQTFMGFDPDRSVGVVVLSNSAHSNTNLGFHIIDPRIPLRGPPSALSRVDGAMLMRYNRVEGLSLGAQRRLDLGPAALHTQLRVGTADQAVRGELALERWGSEVQTRLGAYRRLNHASSGFAEGGPTDFPGALVLGRDDFDYFDARGAELRLRPSLTRTQWYDVRLYAERQGAVDRSTHFSVLRLAAGHRRFRENFTADAADQFGARVVLRGVTGTSTLVPRAVAALSLAGEVGDYRVFRPEVLLRAAAPLPVGLALTVEAAAGSVEGGPVPAQALWRLGGAPTLRGYPGSSIVGEQYWRSRTELSRDAGRLSIALFTDAAAAQSRDGVIASGPLVSIGGGVREMTGLVRLDVAYGLQAPGGWRVHFHTDQLVLAALGQTIFRIGQ
jgi:serine-type D-Ala-D-Ala carboxypeptidase/endopeptidase